MIDMKIRAKIQCKYDLRIYLLFAYSWLPERGLKYWLVSARFVGVCNDFEHVLVSGEVWVTRRQKDYAVLLSSHQGLF